MKIIIKRNDAHKSWSTVLPLHWIFQWMTNCEQYWSQSFKPVSFPYNVFLYTVCLLQFQDHFKCMCPLYGWMDGEENTMEELSMNVYILAVRGPVIFSAYDCALKLICVRKLTKKQTCKIDYWWYFVHNNIFMCVDFFTELHLITLHLATLHGHARINYYFWFVRQIQIF